MKIDENYTIETDKYCSILKYEKKTYSEEKEKEIISKNIWYCANLKSALKKYLNLKIGECKEVSEIIEAINISENRILNI